MCRMRQFLAVLRSFFHFSLLCTFPATLPHQLFFHPSSLLLAVYFLVYLSILLFPNSYNNDDDDDDDNKCFNDDSIHFTLNNN